MQHFPMRSLLTVVFVLFTGLVATPSRGEGCQLARKGSGTEVVATDTFDLFPEVRGRLGKGLAVTILHDAISGGRILRTFGCKVYFDLWEEAYNVTPLAGLGKAAASRWVKKESDLTALCHTGSLVGKDLKGEVAAGVELLTSLDPVSEDQQRKTREWLAERGIGAASGAVLGRAVGAMVDLDQHKIRRRTCKGGAK